MKFTLSKTTDIKSSPKQNDKLGIVSKILVPFSLIYLFLSIDYEQQ